MKWLLTIYKIDDVIVDFGVLWKLGYQIWEENIYKVSIFKQNSCENLISFQRGYLNSVKRMNIKAKTGMGSNMNYKSFIL